MGNPMWSIESGFSILVSSIEFLESGIENRFFLDSRADYLVQIKVAKVQELKVWVNFLPRRLVPDFRESGWIMSPNMRIHKHKLK